MEPVALAQPAVQAARGEWVRLDQRATPGLPGRLAEPARPGRPGVLERLAGLAGLAGRVLLAGLAEFESDLHRHVHKENNILFPRTLARAG